MKTSLRAKLPDRQSFLGLADCFAVGVAVSLPWSTSATSILVALWVLALLATLDVSALRREFISPAGGLPVLLWLLAVAGMLWAAVPWGERFGGLDSFHRLLAVPLLLAQFRNSGRGMLVLLGFLLSATCLLATSWAFVLAGVTIPGKSPGVPVKDYIFQSGIFLVCAFALLGAACDFWRARKRWITVALAFLAVLFLADIAFVAASRTALLVAPLLVIALGYRQFGLKGVLAAGVVAGALAGALWFQSPYLRTRIADSMAELRGYLDANAASSTGEHLEFLKKSWRIVGEAPLIGHGTGSIAEEFRRAKVGETGAASEAPVNPHNQIFAVAIQLGLLGAAVLLAMWAAHFMLFRGSGLVAWIGMIIVVENVVSSLFNSHLFDFSQGWLYVFGVGVAGGTVLKERGSATI
jgi:O-antigen ligase